MTFYLIYNSPTGCQYAWIGLATLSLNVGNLAFALRKIARGWDLNPYWQQSCVTLPQPCNHSEERLVQGWVLTKWRLLAMPSKPHAILGYAYIRRNPLQLFCVFADGERSDQQGMRASNDPLLVPLLNSTDYHVSVLLP
jgi:hypothetical protein